MDWVLFLGLFLDLLDLHRSRMRSPDDFFQRNHCVVASVWRSFYGEQGGSAQLILNIVDRTICLTYDVVAGASRTPSLTHFISLSNTESSGGANGFMGP